MTTRFTLMYGSVSALALGAALIAAAPASAQTAPAASDGGGEVVDELVVTGFRSSLAQALELKRSEAAAVDTILAEDIGKFPDANLAESMQRIPGVALTRGDGGEGRNITVRGLAAQFTRVRINGMEGTSQTGASDIYGSGNSGRSFDFNVFPTEIFTSLAVRKTPSADVEEGSLGATIDLDAPHPLDYSGDLVMTATARGIYNTISKDIDPRVSALVSKKFADGAFGVLGSASYGKRSIREVGYSAVNIIPAWLNGGFCSPIGVTPQNPTNNAVRGTNALNCSAGNPRTGSVAAYNAIMSRLGPQGQPGGGAFFPRIPRYVNSVQDAERMGGNLSLQWQPSESTKVTLDGLYSRYKVTRYDDYMGLLSFARSASNNGQPMTSVRDVEITPDGSVIYGLYDGIDVRAESWVDRFTTEFKQVNLAVEQKFGERFTVRGLAGRSESGFKSPQRGWVNLDAIDVDGVSVDFRDGKTIPKITYGFDVANPANFAYGATLADGTVRGTWGDRKLDRMTKNTTLELEGDWEVNDLFTLKAGVQYRESDYTSTNLSVDPAALVPREMPGGATVASISRQITGVDKLLGRGAPASWLATDMEKWRAAVGHQNFTYCGIECGAGDSRVLEKVTSGYAMATFDTGDRLPVPVRGDVGVRYVHTDQYSSGYVPVANPAGSRFPTRGEKAQAERDYADWLPSGNLVIEVNPELLVRLSAAKVMSRPELGALIPNSGVDSVARRGNISNPFLEPIRANTYDAAVEWYFSEGSLLSLAYFRKDIGSYIQSISSLIPFNQLGLPESLLANSNTRPEELFTIGRQTNTPGGRLQGFEINGQLQFDFLPGFLSNTGALANYTRVKSKINYILASVNGVPSATTTADLVGLSRDSASGTLYYEDDKFSIRSTASYRGGFIRQIPSGGNDSDILGNGSTLFVDASASYNINDQFKILFEVQNITGERNKLYIDSVRRDSLFEMETGRTYTVGLTYRY